MPLTTRCNRCARLFPVYAQQLKARRGRVNCPQCGARFDGVAALLDEPMPGFETQPGRIWTAARVGIGNGRGTGNRSALGLRLGIGSSAPAATQVEPSARRRAAAGPLARLSWVAGSLLLVLALGAQWVWWQRGDLLRDPKGRRALETLCERLGCTLPVPRVPGSLEVLDPTLNPDPAGDGSLSLRLRIANRGRLPQSVPLLELELLDREGDLAATRRFAPEEYAAGAMGPLDPGETRTLSLTIARPEMETSGFKVRLQ